MILSNTVASAAVQGVTVNAAADDNPVLGFSAVGNGRNWVRRILASASRSYH